MNTDDPNITNETIKMLNEDKLEPMIDHGNTATSPQFDHPNIQTLGIGEIVSEEELRIATSRVATLEKMVFDNTSSLKPMDIANPQLIKGTATTMETTIPKKTGENPFLPAHILKQLKQGNHSLLEQIAQSGEALNASTALIRSYKRTAPSNFRSSQDTDDDQDAASIKAERYKIIDDLVNEYLPLIAADLRRKLKLQIDKGKL